MCLLPFQFFVSHNLSSWYNVYFWTFSCSFVYNDSSSVPKKSVNNVAFFVLRMNLLWQHLLLPRHFNYQDNAMTIFHHFKASVEKGKLIVMKRLLIWNHKYEIARNDIKLQQSFATTKTCYMKLEIMKPVPFWSTYQVQ